jgi:hypothetical protein
MRKPTEEQIEAHPEVVDMLEDLGKLASIEALSRSEGGKILVSSLVKDIVGSVDILCAKYSLLTIQEFVSVCADMKSKIDLLRVVSRAKKNVTDLQSMIEDTLKE